MKINIKQTSDFPQPKTNEPKADEAQQSEPKQAKAEVTAPSDGLGVFNMALTESVANLKQRWRKWNMERLQSKYQK